MKPTFLYFFKQHVFKRILERKLNIVKAGTSAEMRACVIAKLRLLNSRLKFLSGTDFLWDFFFSIFYWKVVVRPDQTAFMTSFLGDFDGS